MLMLETCRGL